MSDVLIFETSGAFLNMLLLAFLLELALRLALDFIDQLMHLSKGHFAQSQDEPDFVFCCIHFV